MAEFTLSRRLAAEALGTALLVATVVGSGIMAQSLTSDAALALLANAIATGGMLAVIITLLAPISGAHFNPVVTLVIAIRRGISLREAIFYAAAQAAGGCAGTVLTHLMFGLDLVSTSTTLRTGSGQWTSEVVATFGLLLTILLSARSAPRATAWLVALYITSAYWFSSSTSFANPAVALARSLTSTFSGIRPVDLPGFVLAEVAGAMLAILVAAWMFGQQQAAEPAKASRTQ